MSDQEFEQRLAERLQSHAQGGVRPFDAMEIARRAMYAEGRSVARAARRAMPPWFRALVMAALFVGVVAAAAVVGGFIRLPGDNDPSPSPTAIGNLTPTPSLSVTIAPSPSLTLSPDASPSGSPSASPSLSPTTSPSTSPTASASPSATPSATPATGWREIDFPGNASRVEVNDAAYRDGIYVAVGLVTGSVPAESVSGRAWYSTDGATWTRADENGMTANRVVATDSAFFAVDGSGPQTQIWRSTDGSSWTLAGSSTELAFVNDMAFSNGVIVAVGSNESFDQAMVWTSADGVSWTAIAGPPATSELTRVAVRGGDIVVIGDSFSGYGRRIFVRLDHTTGWQEFDPFGEDVDGRLLDLTTSGGRVLAVGYEDDFDTGERMATVRSSVLLDGWTRTVVGNGNGLVFDQVVALPDLRFLAIASAPSFIVGECQPSGCTEIHEQGQAWLSAGGIEWQLSGQVYERREPAPDEIGDMIEHPRVVVAGLSGVVVLDRWNTDQHVFFAPLASFAE